MLTEGNLEQEFKKVTYKRKGKATNKTKNGITCAIATSIDCKHFDIKKNIRRIEEAKEELLTTDLFQSVSALLKEGLAHIGNAKISKLICCGLGHLSTLTVPRYQLALLLCLKDLLDIEVEASDPIFNKNDVALLEHFQINIGKTNAEGKYNIYTDTVFFYLPHCPRQLMNNLLWSNWGLNLSKCIILGNSINKVVEDNSKKDLNKFAKYIHQICPYVLELVIVNSFQLFEVFNDTSLHFFPLGNLNLLSLDFWEEQEPEYSDSDVEFIRKSVKNKLIL